VGEVPKGKGGRTDLSDATATLAVRNSVVDVAEEHPEVFVKYHRGLKALAFIRSRKDSSAWRDLNVTVIYGATGVGKTKMAFEKARVIDEMPFSIVNDGDSLWWDGYDDEKAIIIDEMAGNFCKYKKLLRILDGHPLRLPVKGAHAWASWTHVYITSSMHPKDWYPKRAEWSELKRRIHSIIHLDPLKQVGRWFQVPRWG
jgi:hypothetical protein